MSKGDALGDVALEALNALLEECLLLLGDAIQRADDLFGTVGLLLISQVHKFQ